MALSTVQFEILFSLTEGRKHGYALILDVRTHVSGAGAATVYRSIERLQSDGLINPDGEEVVDGRLRRFYRLTDRGLVTLEDETRQMAERAQRALSRIRGQQRPALKWGAA
ncbi:MULTISPECIES: PadR family transcriptional regulator [Bacteria]|uniref:PadR family transcriptional regulator n=1 Tax=Bacteria TaxID=2 RepID=UPI003C7C11D8